MNAKSRLVLKLAMAAVAAGLSSTPEAGHAQCFKSPGPLSNTEWNTDRRGTDSFVYELVYRGPYTGILGDPRLSECRSMCDKTATCYSWTYVKPKTTRGSGFCYDNSYNPEPTYNAGMVSGIQYEDYIDRPGSDFLVLDAHDAASCDTFCKREPRCMAWTLVYSTRKCWLKDSVPQAYYNPDTVSNYFIQQCVR